jgi:tetratricopeptide (TPR) repeat protein
MSRRSAVLLIGVLAAVFILAGATYLATRDRLPPREDPAAGRQEVIEAFRGQAADVPADLQRFFDDLGATLRAGGANGGQFWDIPRFARELDRDGALNRAGVRPDDPTLHQGLRAGMDRNFQMLAAAIAYDRTEIRTLRWLVPGREAVVVTRHTGKYLDEPVRFKMRWWLTHDGAWRFYDYEDSSFGGRASILAGSAITELLTRGPAGAPAVRESFAVFQDAHRAVMAGEFEKADRLLADPKLNQLPGVAQPIVDLWRAISAMQLRRPADALRLLDRAERGMPDAPVIFLVRASCYEQTEEWERVVTAGRRYVELIGPDEDICLQLGNALVELGRHAEAAAEYRRALDDAPETRDALAGLIACAGHVDKTEITDRFARFSDPAAHLADLVIRAGNDVDMAEALVRVVREKSPTNPEGLFQAGRLRLRKDDLSGAITLFLQALDHAGEKRARYRDSFAWEMASRGKAVEGYSALPDRDAEAAFLTLADTLREDFDPGKPDDLKTLETLIAAHRKRKPTDLWLDYFQGVLHNRRKEYDAAEQLFAAGMARAKDDDARERFRWERVENLVDANRIGVAYWTVGSRRDTFGQLASRLWSDDKLPRLMVLVWAHGWVDPTDPRRFLWRGHVAFRTEDYQSAVQDLTAYQRAPGTDRLFGMLEAETLARSLLRLGRLKEARAALRPTDPNDYYNRVLDAAITAAGGDVDQTEKELDDLIRSGQGTAERIHADADLNRLLRTPPFKRLLDKYPPPPNEPPGPAKK